MPKKVRANKHIILLRFSAMGDVAMTVPVIRALAQQYPELKITVVSRGIFRPFFDTISPRVHFYDADFTKAHKGILGIWRLYTELRKLHVTAVADLHNVLRSKLLTFFFSSRGKNTATVDKNRAGRKQLTAKKNKVFKPLKPVIENYADVLAKLGYPVDVYSVPIPDKKRLTKDITSTTGKKEGNWIGIAPFAKHKGKVYPKSYITQVIDSLSANTKNKVFLFGGGKEEEEKLLGMAGDKNNIVVIAGKTMNLWQELKLISHLDVMLSMDSANGQMAAIMGSKVVTLWGATHPYAGFVPYKQPLENSLTADREKYPLLPTSIYGNKRVEGYEDAMKTITPQSVVAKIEAVLDAAKKENTSKKQDIIL
ncbi:glycosyltransferase family 9 protein [Flavobacterium rhizosphaerae]|uniref:Glycosyltransferase family 9 protein n=1 Tax=Flavobacterium rhizosphaerae TaxID=3163298 RepID=A0ABW8YZ12_9FLAO